MRAATADISPAPVEQLQERLRQWRRAPAQTGKGQGIMCDSGWSHNSCACSSHGHSNRVSKIRGVNHVIRLPVDLQLQIQENTACIGSLLVMVSLVQFASRSQIPRVKRPIETHSMGKKETGHERE